MFKTNGRKIASAFFITTGFTLAFGQDKVEQHANAAAKEIWGKKRRSLFQ